jgi:hypothetical protein
LWQIAHLGLKCIHSLAAGLRQNVTLKFIKLPWLNLAFVCVFGEALTINRSLESIHVYREPAHDDSDGVILSSLGRMEEESTILFISMLPKMKFDLHQRSL